MNEYKVTFIRGMFGQDRKEVYTNAESAEALAKDVETRIAVNPDVDIQVHTEMYAGERINAPLLISCVDSMDVRREIANNMMHSGYTPHVIDGRSGGGQIEVHTGTVPQWIENMPEVADTDACGARFIAYASQIIGGVIASTVRAHLQGKEPRGLIMHCDTMEVLKL